MVKTQVTKKKKKITIKGSKAPTPESEAKTIAAARPPEAAPESAAPQAVPASVPARPQGKPASYTWAVILALISILLFAVLILLQLSEYNILKLAFPVTAI